MDVNKAVKICHDDGLKVWGVNSKGKMFVQVSEVIEGLPKPKITSSNKIHSSHDSLNKAISDTYIYFANKILQLKK